MRVILKPRRAGQALLKSSEGCDQDWEAGMGKAIDAYREGYEKGKDDNLAGHVGEAMMGMLRNDPGGHFAAGGLMPDLPLPSGRITGTTLLRMISCSSQV